MIAFTEPKSVKNDRSYFQAHLFHRYFLRELVGVSRVAYVVSIIDS